MNEFLTRSEINQFNKDGLVYLKPCSKSRDTTKAILRTKELLESDCQ